LPFDGQSAPEIVKKGDSRLKNSPQTGANKAADQFSSQALNLYADFWVILAVFRGSLKYRFVIDMASLKTDGT
jgi:hypothetical protein